MHILGIDPGVSTGIVLWDSTCGVIENITIKASDPLPEINRLVSKCDAVVMEDVPLFGSSKQSQRYGIILAELIPEHELYSIHPSEWKPIAKALKWDNSKLQTQHEKDAYCLILYAWLFKIKILPVGESK